MRQDLFAKIPRKIRKVLKANDFMLVRFSKHAIYKHVPSGRKVTVSMGKTSFENEKNKIADIKRLLKEVGAVYQEHR